MLRHMHCHCIHGGTPMVCHHHTGTRYFVRGLDTDGNAANFVETEQMVWYQGQVASYVQVSHTPHSTPDHAPSRSAVSVQ